MKNSESLYWFSKVSRYEREDAVIFLRGLWARGHLNRPVKAFLKECSLEIHHFNRVWDILLATDTDAIAIYQEDIRRYIDLLLREGKKVHLFWSSFWWYLGLKVVEVVPKSISSIIAIAPVMNPVTLYDRLTHSSTWSHIELSLADNRQIHILPESLPDDPVKIKEDNQVPWLIFCWGSDTISPSYDLSVIKSPHIIAHTIAGVWHLGILERTDTQEKIHDFYKTVGE
jgi:fumarate reductase subunit C